MWTVGIYYLLIHFSTRPLPTYSWTNPESSELSTIQGIVFEPPDGFHGGKVLREYSKNELRNMLGLVVSNFSRVSTYARGPKAKLTNRNMAKAISEYNLNVKSAVLTLAIALDTDLLYDKVADKNITETFNSHVDDVVKSVVDANTMFPGSVSSVILDWNLTKVLSRQNTPSFQLIVTTVSQSMANSIQIIKVQIRTEDCLEFVKSYAKSMIADSLICHKWPNISNGGVESAKEVEKYFGDIQEKIDELNPGLELIGQTGWPSIGIFQELNGSRDESQRFWCTLQNLSSNWNFSLDVFTAFDGSWRSLVLPNKDPHFGVWRRVKSEGGRADDFAQKFKGCVITDEEKRPLPGNEVDQVTLIVAVVGGATALFLVVVVAGMYVRLKFFKASFLSKSDIEEFLAGARENGERTDGESAWNCPYDTSFEIDKMDLYIDTKTLLGKGAFGSVYLGKLEGFASKVALKQADATSKSSTGLKGMLSEIKILIHVGSHPNVVSIIGAYTAEIKRGLVVIALELCELGSLDAYLRWNKEQIFSKLYSNCESSEENAPILVQKGFTNGIQDGAAQNKELAKLLPKLLQWGSQICSGMEYIASRNVIHADLAARNVLLTQGGICKITDFGLSRRLYEYSNYVKQNQEPMPWRWMSIESLRHLTFSSKSDVWSFGVVLFEIFSLGNIPYGGRSWNTDFVKDLENGLRPTRPQYATNEMYELMKECWNIDSEKRPDFKMLKESIEAIAGYDTAIPKTPIASYIRKKGNTLGKIGAKIRNSMGIF